MAKRKLTAKQRRYFGVMRQRAHTLSLRELEAHFERRNKSDPAYQLGSGSEYCSECGKFGATDTVWSDKPLCVRCVPDDGTDSGDFSWSDDPDALDCD